MAQPELIKDIEARVKKSGDTMTGNLESPMFITDYLKTLNPTDSNNPSFIHMDSNQNLLLYNKNSQGFTQLALLTNKFGLNALQFYYKQDTDTNYSQYTVIHTGNLNLITPQSIGALPISGGTLTGPILNFNNGNGQIYNLDDSTNRLFMFRNVFDSNNWSGLQIESPLNKTDLPRVNFYQTIDGTLKYIGTILHTGNKNLITPADISAYALVPTGISLSTDVLSLAPGRYQWDGMTTSSEATAMNLPAVCWHGEIFIQSTYNITGHTNTYKVVTVTVNSNEIWQNVLSWNQWTGWKKIITAPFSGVSETYGINISGNAITSSYPLGFQYRDTSNNWVNGDFTSDGFTTYITDWHEPSGGDIYWASNAGGKLAAGIDGYFYQGRDSRDYQLHRCLDTYDLANNTFNRANYANYLSNASHNISIGSSTWGASNPWGCTNRTLVWGQSGYNGSYSADTADIVLYYGNTPTSGGAGWFLHIDGGIQSIGGIYGGVWNDYAEFRSSDPIEPGRVICETGNGILKLSTERLQPGANVVSDTFGFAIGETENCKTPIAVSGRALVYTYEDRYNYEAGDPVCAAPGGTVSKMSREEVMMYPDRIVGTVSEIPEYERWGTGNVEVKNRIWIKIK